MIAVITGDIVHSQKGEIQSWIKPLKQTLNQYGHEPKSWELYRGDSFQLSLDIDQALLAAIHLKAAIKQSKIYDVRMGIGLGAVKYLSPQITESNGTAYVNSGACFDALKKETLAIQSPRPELDEVLNIMIRLALLTIDGWSQVVSKVVKTAIEHPGKNQKELAQLLDKSQSNISEALQRGGYDEVMRMNAFYKKSIAQL